MKRVFEFPKNFSAESWHFPQFTHITDIWLHIYLPCHPSCRLQDRDHHSDFDPEKKKFKQSIKKIQGGFPGGSAVNNPPVMQETHVWLLSQEDPLEKEITTHSSTLAWKIPWMEELCRLQSMGLQRVKQNWATSPPFFLAFPILKLPGHLPSFSALISWQKKKEGIFVIKFS